MYSYYYPLGYFFGTTQYDNSQKTTQYPYYKSSQGNNFTQSTYKYYYIPLKLKSVTVTGDFLSPGAFYNCELIENITIKRSDTHIQGKNFNSVTFMVGDIKFVQFNMDEDNPLLEWASAWDGDENDELTLAVVGEVSINEYLGQLTPQFIIQDLTIQD